MNKHAIAISIEHDLREEYSLERHDLGGFANADLIERRNLSVMVMVLLKYYYGDNKNRIDRFIIDNSYLTHGDNKKVSEEKLTETYVEYKKLIKLLRD